jgi:hypothetical protein
MPVQLRITEDPLGQQRIAVEPALKQKAPD